MEGKHVVLTGANAGLGFATAVALLEAGAKLTLVIRDPKKLESMQQALLLPLLWQIVFKKTPILF